MMLIKKLLFSLILGTMIFSVAACEREEGPMEEAGEKIDETTEKVGEKLKDAVN